MKGMSKVEQERARELRALKSLEQRYHHDIMSVDERAKVRDELLAMRKRLGVNG
jgi:hypothetical protein